MYSTVIEAMPKLNKPLEGFVLWPYQDILGLVTVGVGCLIEGRNEDPSPALGIHWEGNPDAATIRREFAKVNALPKAMHFDRYRAACSLRITEATADALLESRALDFEVVLRKYFPDWDAFPADAQLAILAMSWACGPGFPRTFTNFAYFVNVRDWVNAAKCAKIREQGNAGIVPRNKQVALCLANAAAIDNEGGYSTPALYWPGVVRDELAPLAKSAEHAVASFSIEDCGLTGHCHEQAA